jgi:hypothetical protein
MALLMPGASPSADLPSALVHPAEKKQPAILWEALCFSRLG